MGKENWRVAWEKRRPGIPILNWHRVGEGGKVLDMPTTVREREYPAMGATVKIVEFPGDPDMVGPWTNDWRQPAARSRMGGGENVVPSPLTPNTVSNLRRDQLAGIDQVPPGHLDIIEGSA